MENLDLSKDPEPDAAGREIYSKLIRAGKRTYFFDVRTTRGNDFFLTITESRKKNNRDGSTTYDKNKIFLYKEDFDKFSDGLVEALSYVRNNATDTLRTGTMADAADIEFESL